MAVNNNDTLNILQGNQHKSKAAIENLGQYIASRRADIELIQQPHQMGGSIGNIEDMRGSLF